MFCALSKGEKEEGLSIVSPSVVRDYDMAEGQLEPGLKVCLTNVIKTRLNQQHSDKRKTQHSVEPLMRRLISTTRNQSTLLNEVTQAERPVLGVLQGRTPPGLANFSEMGSVSISDIKAIQV